ncbi:MAG: hypothetical protein M3067_09000 [Chloroflexota bacterium]|nr:hypothetical protein [Chloroflexota bacterium]
MGGGYVLDFTDRTFAELFRDYGVQIDHPKYSAEGASKAKRLRYFLRITPPPLSGKVLAGLLEYSLASGRDIDQGVWEQVAGTASRLGGSPPGVENARAKPKAELTEEELLRRSLRPAAVAAATRNPAMAAIVLERMQEAERCIGVESHLAAVVLAGSVLEALCLDFGAQYPERVNRGYEAVFGKAPPKLHEWSLRSWIEVLGRTGDLSPNIEKFGHGLRDFRNYIHPAQQLASGFRPDKHTANISLRVVVAAIDDLAAAYARLGSATK